MKVLSVIMSLIASCMHLSASDGPVELARAMHHMVTYPGHSATFPTANLNHPEDWNLSLLTGRSASPARLIDGPICVRSQEGIELVYWTYMDSRGGTFTVSQTLRGWMMTIPSANLSMAQVHDSMVEYVGPVAGLESMALAYDSNGEAVIDAYETERKIPGLRARDGAIVIRTAGTASMLLAKRDVGEEGEEQVPFIMDVASSYGWMSGTPPQKATITTP